jgi:hypothetical protein
MGDPKLHSVTLGEQHFITEMKSFVASFSIAVICFSVVAVS